MPVALKLLPLLKDERVRHVLEGLLACLIILISAFGTMMTGHNLQWYGNNTVSSDFAPLVTDTEEKIDEGSLNTSLLYSAYITLFDNNRYADKDAVRKRLIACFYRTSKEKNDNGTEYEVTEAIEDSSKIFDRIQDEFGITLDESERQYMSGLAQLFNGGKSYVLSGNVTVYYEIISKYCEKYGITDYVALVEAVMQQESGGSGSDPMQCSESPYNTQYPNTPNAITDPDYSIEIGVKYLASCLKAAECKSEDDTASIGLALQGYNFGNGYISWAIDHGGYSAENASEFSQMECQKLGVSSYGDVNYVSHVLRYYDEFKNTASGDGTFIYPIQKGNFTISSGFGERTDPITGGTEFHKGIDLAALKGTPIHASAAGTVLYAQFASHPYSGYGNLVIIRNSSSLVTMYGHCSELLVSVGQTVRQGDVIAEVGSTGSSTGNHCHFEIRVNGSSVNPLSYLS